ncbi:MAG: caspase family protein [Anaerolineae bacterium]|nr:caspase family protein [Anaerolineae bacterium]
MHIAVDKYRHAGPFLPNLAGCENDIRAMRQLLTSRFGFEERNAVLLINEQGHPPGHHGRLAWLDRTDAGRRYRLHPVQRPRIADARRAWR